MSLFQQNYNKPGPGVERDTPRKTGLARIVEVISRDFFSFWKASLLLLLSCTPLALGVYLALLNSNAVLMLLTSALGGLIAGPQLCGIADTILRSLRDEAGFWWHTYAQAWKRNVRFCLLPGAVMGILVGMQFFVVSNLSKLTVTAGLAVALILGILLSVSIFLLVWMQSAVMNLSFGNMIRNAVLLILISPLRAVGAVAVQILYWGAVWLWSPVSLVIFALTGAWLPFLLGIFLLYKPLEQNFELEKNISNLQAEKYAD